MDTVADAYMARIQGIKTLRDVVHGAKNTTPPTRRRLRTPPPLGQSFGSESEPQNQYDRASPIVHREDLTP